MIYVGQVTLWEMLKTLYMGTTVAEFNDIGFKTIIKTFEFIQVYFNENIFITD